MNSKILNIFFTMAIIFCVIEAKAQDRTADNNIASIAKDTNAVRKATYGEAGFFSNKAKVAGRDAEGLLVIYMYGPENMIEKMQQDGKIIHAMYEDPDRDRNTEMAVCYDTNNNLSTIKAGILMDGDDFILPNGRQFFSVDEIKNYVDVILGQYIIKAGERVPATPTTPTYPLSAGEKLRLKSIKN